MFDLSARVLISRRVSSYVLLSIVSSSVHIEHVYPYLALILRLIMSFFVFAGIVLDCLDGMQARRTNRCTKV